AACGADAPALGRSDGAIGGDPTPGGARNRFPPAGGGGQPAGGGPVRPAVPRGVQCAAADAAGAGGTAAAGAAGVLRALRGGGAGSPERPAGEVRGAWDDAVRDPGRAEGAANLGAGE